MVGLRRHREPIADAFLKIVIQHVTSPGAGEPK
jgi:hypothetical protein